MSVLKFPLVLIERFISMHASMFPDIVGVHLSLNSSGSMASKRVGSKDTDGSTIGKEVE